MTSIIHKKSDQNQTVISSYSYGYDEAGNRSWVKRASGKGDVFKYDATDQLTNVLYEATNPDTTPSAWTNQVAYYFDAAGNRTNVTATNSGTTVYIPNPLNQYTNIGGTPYAYDGNGNQADGGNSWTYLYDRENRFVAAIVEDEGELVRSITNTYDTFGRLIEERVKWASNAYYTNRYVYDDQWRMLAWYYSDPNTSVVIKYVYGPGIDEPVRLNTGVNGTNFYYHAAALDTVTELTDGAGVKVEQYSYDVYGTPTFRDGNGNPRSDSNYGNVLLFQGRVRDRYLGLYNFRNRYYSPGLGRFLQVDPVRLKIWNVPDLLAEYYDHNLYRALQNDPLSVMDANGEGLRKFLKKWFCAKEAADRASNDRAKLIESASDPDASPEDLDEKLNTCRNSTVAACKATADATAEGMKIKGTIYSGPPRPKK